MSKKYISISLKVDFWTHPWIAWFILATWSWLRTIELTVSNTGECTSAGRNIWSSAANIISEFTNHKLVFCCSLVEDWYIVGSAVPDIPSGEGRTAYEEDDIRTYTSISVGEVQKNTVRYNLFRQTITYRVTIKSRDGLRYFEGNNFFLNNYYVSKK